MWGLISAPRIQIELISGKEIIKSIEVVLVPREEHCRVMWEIPFLI